MTSHLQYFAQFSFRVRNIKHAVLRYLLMLILHKCCRSEYYHRVYLPSESVHGVILSPCSIYTGVSLFHFIFFYILFLFSLYFYTNIPLLFLSFSSCFILLSLTFYSFFVNQKSYLTHNPRILITAVHCQVQCIRLFDFFIN